MEGIFVPAVLENQADWALVRRGVLPANQVRRVEVAYARIDPDVPGLLLSPGVIAALGLEPLRPQTAHTVNVGRVVVLTVKGRDCVMDVDGVADFAEVTIGRIPLLAMDWHLDRRMQKLVCNPDHGGEWMVEVPHAEELQ